MRLWVTRPVLDAAVLRTKLVAQGHDVMIYPLLIIEFPEIGLLDIDHIQALIATSRNGVRAAANAQQAEAIKQLRLFAVGPGTASAAKSLGFERVIEGPSTAEHLLPVISAHADCTGKMLLHLAGAHLAFDLPGKLSQADYKIAHRTSYIARSARQLPAALLSQIIADRVDGVILLSPRTAQTYADLIVSYQIESFARRFTHFCLSCAVADRLSRLQPEDVRIPQRPNISEMLALIG